MQKKYFEDMGYARLDTDRRHRTGFSEVVFCSGKRDEFLVEIFQKLYDIQDEVLGTRATEEQFQVILKHMPQVEYDPVSRLLMIQKE